MKKYLCKKEKEGCRNIINSYQELGSIQLTFEDPPGSFRVTMTQMDWEDAGVYYCGAGEYGKDKTSKELEMFIYEGELFSPSSLLLFRSITSTVTLFSKDLNFSLLLSYFLIYRLLFIHLTACNVLNHHQIKLVSRLHLPRSG